MSEYDPPTAASIRKKYSTDQLMNQFLKTEGGGLGRSPEYRRGWTWNYEWCSSDPEKAQPEKVAAVNALMSGGMTFADAFDAVSTREGAPAPCCGCTCGWCEHQGGDNRHSERCVETAHGSR